MLRILTLSVFLLILGCDSQPIPAPTNAGPTTPKRTTQSEAINADKQASAPEAQPTAEFWTRFRGPNGQGSSSAKGLPISWGPNENIVWKTQLPGGGISCPVRYGNRLFVTSYSGYNVPGQPNGSMDDLQLHVLCLNPQTGKLLWQKDVAPKLPEQAAIRENHGYASNTPVVDSERVYAFFGKSGVVAFDHTGTQHWRSYVGSGLSGWGSAASPILYKDLVIVNASVESESLVALDKRTGKQVWQAEGIREAWNTPVVVKSVTNRDELIVPINNKILAFDPNTGKQLWSCVTDIHWYMVPGVVAQDGIVYCIGGRSGGALAVKTGGSGDVTDTHRLWTGTKGSNVSSPVLHDGHLYWMHESQSIAYCAEAKTGKIIYENRVDRAGQIYAAAILADGNIYYVSRNGRTFVVPARPEWEILATNELEERGHFDSSPVVDGNRILLRSNRYLYCLGKSE